MADNEPRRGWRLPARLWWWLLLAAVGGVTGGAYAALAEPVYVARAYVAVVPDEAQSHEAAVSFAQAYGRIVPQPEVVAAVVADSAGWSDGPPATPAEVRSQVRSSTSPDAPVIEVAGQAGSAVRAADLANGVAGGLVAHGNQREDQTGVRLAVLGEAFPPPDPDSPNPPLSILVGSAAGLTVAVLVTAAGTTRRAGAAPEDASTTGVPPVDSRPAVDVGRGADL